MTLTAIFLQFFFTYMVTVADHFGPNYVFCTRFSNFADFFDFHLVEQIFLLALLFIFFFHCLGGDFKLSVVTKAPGLLGTPMEYLFIYLFILKLDGCLVFFQEEFYLLG